MSLAGVKFSIALILACVFMVIAPGLAAEPATLKFPPLFGKDPEVVKCLSTLHNVKGCFQEIITSFLSHQVKLIGPACCEALNEVDDKCWPKLFPFDPFFPTLLKNYCAKVAHGVASPFSSLSPSPSPSPSIKVLNGNRNNKT
ncbi:hypothetical protein Ddye_030743 [Dipteronia dyeriana]|uniref:Prolamin-like domain-containing protein n=1 Tax=Dipteronia dyeriana TaxID=168575 RepID=A0AAD9TH78_9ROSI|nr:hypothetical protein Ddye_030743 [Dipteronia dyeriana]